MKEKEKQQSNISVLINTPHDEIIINEIIEKAKNEFPDLKFTIKRKMKKDPGLTPIVQEILIAIAIALGAEIGGALIYDLLKKATSFLSEHFKKRKLKYKQSEKEK